MTSRPRNLIPRTFEFAAKVRKFVNQLPRSISNYEDGRQLTRASGSVAANYLEAQEGLSRRDFFYRIKICRKESREAGLWLRLLEIGSSELLIKEREDLVAEADELKHILSAIAAKDDTES